MQTSPPQVQSGDSVAGLFHSDVPARLDRLPWSRFHWLVIVALGITWILDGLEVTLVGSLSAAIEQSTSLDLGSAEIGLSASAYLAGAVIGALGFGYLTDRWGRKRLFTLTVAIYAVATVMTGLAWNFWSFALFRALTGAGIGGEYSAINSAIQELIPARFRGRVDLAINGSFWIGAALGAGGSLLVLNPAIVPAELGWRLAFLLGGALGLLVIGLRRYLPESPRWLMTHGQPEQADRVVREIENRVYRQRPGDRSQPAAARMLLRPHEPLRLGLVCHTLFVRYARRAWLGVALMSAQAFLYNAIFFTYALVLSKFYSVPAARIGWYILPFAAGNFAGPLLLGPLFDIIGRRVMITATYALAGGLLALTGLLFQAGLLGATSQTVAWTVIFFFASAAASAAYLTVGEGFPLELRALAIALFYAFGTGLGGVVGPALFGVLIASGERLQIMWGYQLGAALMVGAAVAEYRLGFAAERRSLETVAPPLSAHDGN